MAVKEINDPELLLHVGDHALVILKYHAKECGAECDNIINAFKRFSNDLEYKDILFLRINAEGNPNAKQFVESKKTCIISIYCNGKLIDSRFISTEAQLLELLAELNSRL